MSRLWVNLVVRALKTGLLNVHHLSPSPIRNWDPVDDWGSAGEGSSSISLLGGCSLVYPANSFGSRLEGDSVTLASSQTKSLKIWNCCQNFLETWLKNVHPLFVLIFTSTWWGSAKLDCHWGDLYHKFPFMASSGWILSEWHRHKLYCDIHTGIQQLPCVYSCNWWKCYEHNLDWAREAF